MQPLLELPEQTPPSEIDEEILDIFVEEVNEVLEEIISSFTAWKTDPNDTEALKTLRRNFHTLKGSGRLVGAMVIGELGWRFENLLNRVIDGNIPPNDAVLFLLDKVEEFLPSMVAQFKNHQPAPYEVRLLISQAHQLTETKGQSMGEFAPPGETATVPSAKTVPKATVPAAKPALVSKTKPIPETTIAPAKPSLRPKERIEDIVEEADIEEAEMTFAIESLLQEEENLNLVHDDLATFLPTARDLEESVNRRALQQVQVQDQENLLAGDQLEEMSEDEIQYSELLSPSDMDFEGIPQSDIQFEEYLPSGEYPMGEIPAVPVTLVEGDIEQPDKFELEIIKEARITAPELLAEPLPASGEGDGAIDPKLFAIFNKEANQHLTNLKKSLNNCEQTAPIKIDQEIVRAFHTLHGSSLSVGIAKIANIVAPMENYARALLERQTELSTEKLAHFYQAIVLTERVLNNQTISEEEQEDFIDNIQMALETLPVLPKILSKPPETTQPTAEPTVPDAADEFMAIFLDEAEEILENTQSLLERWQTTPHNLQLMKELQRELHTLKGGARMVGISAMGDLSHSLESVLTRIVEGGAHSNPKLQEIVQNSVDELAAMLEAVRASVPLEMPNDLIAQIHAALVPEGEEPGEPVIVPPLPPKPTVTATTVAPVASVEKKMPDDSEAQKVLDKMMDKEPDLGEGGEDRIRVRVALIDKLTNLVGELSISRAHLEQQQGAVKNNLSEMEQTVARLRDQLRRLEIETEAQILSHFKGAAASVKNDKEDFDPLELDRFSVMQQLSRSLLESISDLLNIQDTLKILSRQSDNLLIQQTRMGAELQDAIMRTRMIPFSRITPRLQRIARLTARELRKQVDFIINGENIEFERTVLNRLVAPLEHMLRNAIGHGIEDAATRQQAGKPAMAKITIDINKEGTELILKLSDDGAGLDLTAIRKKAEERGMIKADTVISDYDLMQFILEPSFSTAKVVTQISGRGVGMDVVNNEIKQLNSALHIYSKSGQGTLFEIRLPLSLTINQALLVHIGEETMAVPMNNVEAVMRAPRLEVLGAEGERRYYKYMGHDYRVHQLGDLLGFGKLTIDKPLIPTLLIRAVDRRVALLVDNIEGNKEIVVKSIGPQIGAIRWLAGATILGDGRVVLILDVPALTRVDKELPYIPSASVAQVLAEEPPVVAKTIMVVDDSITVRKVTARLLKRQGMEVITAKDGVDAVAQLQEHIPDLMLLDVEMPRMDGYELATQIRNTTEWKHIPIIMITSRTGTKHRDRAEKIGIDRYLGKPFNETELLENINALLND